MVAEKYFLKATSLPPRIVSCVDLYMFIYAHAFGLLLFPTREEKQCDSCMSIVTTVPKR